MQRRNEEKKSKTLEPKYETFTCRRCPVRQTLGTQKVLLYAKRSGNELVLMTFSDHNEVFSMIVHILFYFTFRETSITHALFTQKCCEALFSGIEKTFEREEKKSIEKGSMPRDCDIKRMKF